MQLIRPTRLQAWVFVAGCGFSSMFAAAATALFMRPTQVNVVVVRDSHYAEPAKEQLLVSNCHTLDVHALMSHAEARTWFLAGDLRQTRDARLVPAVADGEFVGLKIYAIRTGSIYDRVGLINGDTLHSIEGVALMSPDSESLLRDKLLADGVESMAIGITRQGCPATLHIGLQ